LSKLENLGIFALLKNWQNVRNEEIHELIEAFHMLTKNLTEKEFYQLQVMKFRNDQLTLHTKCLE